MSSQIPETPGFAVGDWVVVREAPRSNDDVAASEPECAVVVMSEEHAVILRTPRGRSYRRSRKDPDLRHATWRERHKFRHLFAIAQAPV